MKVADALSCSISKNAMKLAADQKSEANCFDATVAAYLLNPLKSDYTYEDVAREQLEYCN